MIRAKTISSASMTGLSRRSMAGNGGACLKLEKRACFAGPLHRLAAAPAPAMPQVRLVRALCAGRFHPRAAARLLPKLLKSP
jgi:hypothetical protein